MSPTSSKGMRLNRYLASRGIASRRKAEEFIREGRVRVDGEIVHDLGRTIEPGASVTVDGRPVPEHPGYLYIALNKPPGYLTARRDMRGRPTVMDLLPVELRMVHPVGRLDLDTGGLLLLTNDGDLTFGLSHPRHEVEKLYQATISGHLSPEEVARLEAGIPLEDGMTAPARVETVAEDPRESVVRIFLREGRKRQVKRMFRWLGHPVRHLVRIAVGPVQLEDLPQGRWRYLTEIEVDALRAATRPKHQPEVKLREKGIARSQSLEEVPRLRKVVTPSG